MKSTTSLWTLLLTIVIGLAAFGAREGTSAHAEETAELNVAATEAAVATSDVALEGSQANRPVSIANPVEIAAHERIRAALSDQTMVDFFELPLDEAMRYFTELHEIPVLLDRRALEDIGVSTDVPVTLHVSEISLRSALRLILRDLELTYLIGDEVLLITTPEIAERRLQVRVYPVGELIGNSDASSLDFMALVEMVTTTVYPDSWEEVGGTGTIIEANRTLVVSQTEEVHETINALLDVLASVGETHWDAQKAESDNAQRVISGGGNLCPFEAPPQKCATSAASNGENPGFDAPDSKTPPSN